MAGTVLPKNSPRFTQLQLASSGTATPAFQTAPSGYVNSHVLENAFFSEPVALTSSTGANHRYLELTRPSSICSFIIQATLSITNPPDYLDPPQSRPFTHYVFTSGTDVSNSIEYESLSNIPYNTWFWSLFAPFVYFPNYSSYPNLIYVTLPLKGNPTSPPSYLIQGTMKTFVTPNIPTP